MNYTYPKFCKLPILCSSLGIFDSKQKFVAQESESSSDDEGNIGGLFKKVSRDQEKLKLNKDSMNLTESSLILPWGTFTRNWLDADVSTMLNNAIFSIVYIIIFY